jgi:hypothetical protein
MDDMKGRYDWVPVAAGYVLVLMAIGLLAAYCVRVSPDVPATPTPTAAPVATMTSTPERPTPAPTVTAYISVPVVPTRTPAPATKTPDHPPSALPSQAPSNDQGPTPTAVLQPAPAQVPHQRSGR